MKIFKNLSKIIIILIFFKSSTFAQEFKTKKEDLNLRFKAEYQVLKSDKDIKEGLYSVIDKKTEKIAARGNYKNNSPSGNWLFFDKDGELEQRYNFIQKQIFYNKQRNVDSNMVKYEFPFDLKPTDSLIFPIKIGGINFGCTFIYMPDSKIAEYMRNKAIQRTGVNNYLSIDSSGNLISWITILEVDGKKFTRDINTISDFDKLFIPGKLNNQNVSSTFIFKSYMSSYITTSTRIIR